MGVRLSACQVRVYEEVPAPNGLLVTLGTLGTPSSGEARANTNAQQVNLTSLPRMFFMMTNMQTNPTIAVFARTLLVMIEN